MAALLFFGCTPETGIPYAPSDAGTPDGMTQGPAGDIPTAPGAPMHLPDATPPITTPPPAPMTRFLCDQAPPEGAPQPAALRPYSGGTCPDLSTGQHAFVTGGQNREVIIVTPENVMPGEQLPVVFFWHWLGGSADSFLRKGDLLRAANEQRFIGVIPNSKRDLLFKWPFTIADAQPRIDEELRFFDDLLACVAAQHPVNRSCVSSVGVSAGALWTAQLAGARGDYLSSIVVLSGGTGGGVIQPYRSPAHKMPALVLWGGATDVCIVVTFDPLSRDLEQGLARDGHFLVECQHNCGHSVPPVEAPEGMSQFAPLWEFVLDHPYWLAPGESPYASGLPPSFPAWCGIGAGSSTPRTGSCPEPPAC